jgi:hypothetical protein
MGTGSGDGAVRVRHGVDVVAATKLVSHHLGVLRRAGFVASRREGQLVMLSAAPHGSELLAVLGVGEPDEVPPIAVRSEPTEARGHLRSGDASPDSCSTSSASTCTSPTCTPTPACDMTTGILCPLPPPTEERPCLVA